MATKERPKCGTCAKFEECCKKIIERDGGNIERVREVWGQVPAAVCYKERV